MKPLVSVILPVYNGEAHIAEAISSIMQQSMSALELIVIDDASTDNTACILESFQASRFVVLRSARRRGIAACLNEGVRTARAETIARMDSDDVSLPHRMRTQWDFLERHPAIDVLGSECRKIDDLGQVYDYVCFFRADAEIKLHMALEPREAFMSHPSIMMKKEALVRTGYYDESLRLTQDKDLFIRMAQNGCAFANLCVDLLKRRKPAPEHHGNENAAIQHEEFRREVYAKHREYLLGLRERLTGMVPADFPQDNRREVREARARLFESLGKGFLTCRRPQQARKAFSTALRWNPNRRKAYEGLVASFRKDGRYPGGVMGRALDFRPLKKTVITITGGTCFASKARAMTPAAGTGGIRIALVANESVASGEYCSGLAHYIRRLSDSLADTGYEAHVIAPSKARKASEGVVLHSVTMARPEGLLRWLLVKCGVMGFFTRLHFNWQVYQKLRRLQREKGVDFVQYTSVYASGLIAARLLAIPYAVRISSDRQSWQRWSRMNVADKRLCEWMEDLQIRLSPEIFVPSELMKKHLEKRFPAKRLRVIRTPVFHEAEADEALMDPAGGRPYVLFFGGFKRSKGFDVLAEALKSFLADEPDACAVMIGKDRTDEIFPSMRAHAEALCAGHLERIMLMDPMPHERLYPIVAGARIVVLPSRVDNLPNTCLEAMMLGRPVVGTRGTSFEEMITDGVNGFLAEPGDVEDLIKVMKRAWHHPDLSEIRRKATEKAAEFRPEHTVADLVSYYGQVIGTWKKR